MSSMVTPGVYRHYKGGTYRVLGVARNTETGEETVVYESLYDASDYPAGSLWARPLAMFLETVEVGGAAVPRFARTED